MKEDVRHAARKAESSRTLQLFARAGYVANGVVHILIGVIVLVVAFGGAGESDQAGAFKTIADAPFGFAVLWILAIALCALAVWHILEGVLARRDTTAAKWGARMSEWGQAAVFLALGALAVSVALGARPDPDEAAQNASRGVLVIPGGVFVLAAVGLGTAIAGVVFIVMGARRSFEKRVTIPSGPVGRTVVVVGVVGFIAKGIALLIVGVLLLVAAVQVDPNAAGGLDAAISALMGLPSGPWLAGLVGAGLCVYGLFCVIRARFARL